MGNERWLHREINQLSPISDFVILEIGAGDGSLIRKLARLYPQAKCFGYDLQPQPAHLPANVTWYSGDIRNARLPHREENTPIIFICSMFLHHFEDAELSLFRQWIEHCDAAIIVEPWRNHFVKFLSLCIYPFCNSVTKHDMRVSIEAGFCGEDLTNQLTLPPSWSKKIIHHWLGSYRLILQRHETD